MSEHFEKDESCAHAFATARQLLQALLAAQVCASNSRSTVRHKNRLCASSESTGAESSCCAGSVPRASMTSSETSCGFSFGRPIVGVEGTPIERKRVREDECFIKTLGEARAPRWPTQHRRALDFGWLLLIALDPASYARAHISYFGSAYFAAYRSTAAQQAS